MLRVGFWLSLMFICVVLCVAMLVHGQWLGAIASAFFVFGCFSTACSS